MKRIAIIPIDNRPVCYKLIEQITSINGDIELHLPSRNLLGDLTKNADVEGILAWAKALKNIDYFIVSLDTVAYGGLVSSRRTTETKEEILNKIEQLTKITKGLNCKTYAFSSIMRISNNNINEEEKGYWSQYGKRIFDYSFNLHKSTVLNEYNDQCKFSCIEKTIPADILDDYISTRKRNFEINEHYLTLVEQGVFDFLVFSKDDCAKYGLNVGEANLLQTLINNKNHNAQVKTGADEIPLCLLSKAITDGNQKIKIAPIFLNPEHMDKISKYEDISVQQSVANQIKLCGAQIVSTEEADMLLYVNNFIEEQGEIVMNINSQGYRGDFKLPQKPYIIADVAFANGSDNCFIKQLLTNSLDMETFYGYSAWNTTANSLGSLIATACIKFLAQDYNELNFKKSQFTRLLDDYAYQANVRQLIKSQGLNTENCNISTLMKPYEITIQSLLKLQELNASYKFPWTRLFEIEVVINN